MSAREENKRLRKLNADMLAALQAYIAWADATPDFSSSITDQARDLTPIIEQIRAAIAKATGAA